MGAEKLAFSLDKREGYTFIKLEGVLDSSNSKPFEVIIDELCAPKVHIVVDCDGVFSTPPDWLRSLLRIHLNLKRERKGLRLINVSSKLLSNFKTAGVEKTFKCYKDLRSALADTGVAPPKRTLDTEFINPFLHATIRVLKVQAQVDATAGQIYLKRSSESRIGFISGVIGIVSDQFQGSIIISFPEKTFLHVISSMLGETFHKIDKDIIDGAGELTNMIFGQAKIILNEKGYGIKTAIPSVVSGKDHSLSAMTKGPVVVVPFSTSAGDFFIEISLSQ